MKKLRLHPDRLTVQTFALGGAARPGYIPQEPLPGEEGGYSRWCSLAGVCETRFTDCPCA